MIQDHHFIYPHNLDPDAVCTKIEAVLARSKNADVLADERWGLANGIARWCREYDFGPAWVLISLQRERSLLGLKATDVHDYLYALGYVGQDGPGTKNPRWNGLIPQTWLCVHQSAWLAGFGSGDQYGVLQQIRPEARRWNPNNPSPIQLYSAPNVKDKVIIPASLTEHVVYSYTPHAEAMPKASEYLHDFAPEFE